jgi:hypothetical protein
MLNLSPDYEHDPSPLWQPVPQYADEVPQYPYLEQHWPLGQLVDPPHLPLVETVVLDLLLQVP